MPCRSDGGLQRGVCRHDSRRGRVEAGVIGRIAGHGSRCRGQLAVELHAVIGANRFSIWLAVPLYQEEST